MFAALYVSLSMLQERTDRVASATLLNKHGRRSDNRDPALGNRTLTVSQITAPNPMSWKFPVKIPDNSWFSPSRTLKPLLISSYADVAEFPVNPCSKTKFVNFWAESEGLRAFCAIVPVNFPVNGKFLALQQADSADRGLPSFNQYLISVLSRLQAYFAPEHAIHQYEISDCDSDTYRPPDQAVLQRIRSGSRIVDGDIRDRGITGRKKGWIQGESRSSQHARQVHAGT
jgi:hypothetical protein